MCYGSHPKPRHTDFFLVASQEVVAGSWLDYILKNYIHSLAWALWPVMLTNALLKFGMFSKDVRNVLPITFMILERVFLNK